MFKLKDHIKKEGMKLTREDVRKLIYSIYNVPKKEQQKLELLRNKNK